MRPPDAQIGSTAVVNPRGEVACFLFVRQLVPMVYFTREIVRNMYRELLRNMYKFVHGMHTELYVERRMETNC